MKFVPKVRNIDAIQLTADISYVTGGDGRFDMGHNNYIAHKGDWFVVADGVQSFVTNTEFNTLYRQEKNSYDRS